VQDYRSRIRGDRNFYQSHAASRPVYAQADPPGLLLALSAQAIDIHKDGWRRGAGVPYEESFKVDAGALEARGLRPMPVPSSRWRPPTKATRR